MKKEKDCNWCGGSGCCGRRFYAVSGGSRGEAQLPQVSVTKAETGDVEEIVDATGTVVSDEQKTFYSPVNAQIKKYLLQKAIPSQRVQNLWNLS